MGSIGVPYKCESGLKCGVLQNHFGALVGQVVEQLLTHPEPLGSVGPINQPYTWIGPLGPILYLGLLVYVLARFGPNLGLVAREVFGQFWGLFLVP